MSSNFVFSLYLPCSLQGIAIAPVAAVSEIIWRTSWTAFSVPSSREASVDPTGRDLMRCSSADERLRSAEDRLSCSVLSTESRRAVSSSADVRFSCCDTLSCLQDDGKARVEICQDMHKAHSVSISQAIANQCVQATTFACTFQPLCMLAHALFIDSLSRSSSR